MYYIKVKKFYLSKDTIKSMKRQATDFVKIFAMYVTTNGLYMEYVRNPHRSIRKRQTIHRKIN